VKSKVQVASYLKLKKIESEQVSTLNLFGVNVKDVTFNELNEAIVKAGGIVEKPLRLNDKKTKQLIIYDSKELMSDSMGLEVDSLADGTTYSLRYSLNSSYKTELITALTKKYGSLFDDTGKYGYQWGTKDGFTIKLDVHPSALSLVFIDSEVNRFYWDNYDETIKETSEDNILKNQETQLNKSSNF
jgi:hypothetical protein